MEMTLSQWAIQLPESTKLFNRYGIDFCFEGERSLAFACDKLKLNQKEILSELELLKQKMISSAWPNRPMFELIDHIITFYHDSLRKLFPELIMLADKVEKVHIDHDHCPMGLSSMLQEIYDDLQDHMLKEEQILFPLIKNGQGHNAGMPIKVMRSEHDLHGENLNKLKDLAFNFSAPDTSSPS